MTRETLDQLEARDDFIRRHIGPNDADVRTMLKTVGVASVEELIDNTVPAAIRDDTPLAIGNDKTERGTISYLRKMAGRNQVFASMIGM
ncbi:MAG: hypothetical protein HOH04_07585, partial [Rhodospirillaceae bacterium]|nr:hypothetical protein [Rhodospirillaceae bacterium]